MTLELALLFSLILFGCCLGCLMVWREQKRNQKVEARLRRLYQSQPPPRLEFKGHLFNQLMDHPLGQPIVAVPGHQNCLLCSEISTLGLPLEDGPNTSGPKPEPSPGVNPDSIQRLWETVDGRLVSFNYGPVGSDTRGRVRTIGLTPSSTPAQPTGPTSTAADGSSGLAGHDYPCPWCDAS